MKKTYKAEALMDKISKSAWRCADPGIQFDTTINRWHTCPNTARIQASNPCSEYMFVDDSACNLASINLMKYLRKDGTFDVDGFRHACRIFFIAQEIIVDFASYPTELIAKNSHDYRPLGLGYANLGAMLMVQGIPYDSEAGRTTAAAVTAVMTGTAYTTSAEIASNIGPFAGYEKNREPMLDVMRMHRDAAYEISEEHGIPELVAAAREDWDQAVASGEKHGYRNAQATVLAPTGTIGLLMDCDTTGVEPDYALVKFKKLAGGGYFKIMNGSLSLALRNLGYDDAEIGDISRYILGAQSFSQSPNINRKSLLAKGLRQDDIDRAEAGLAGAFDLESVFSSFNIGEEVFEHLKIAREKWSEPGFSLLIQLGFTSEQIEEASEYLCGTMTIEGAPHIRQQDLPVFDCANRCGANGKRFIHYSGHIRMMAAVQPFISGAISKTINMPDDVTTDDIHQAYLESWRLGLKAVALYRDGCKSSQPLKSSSKNEKSNDSDSAALAAAKELIRHLQQELSRNQPVLKRRRLPRKRRGSTQEATISGQKVYLRTGEYEDGTLGEIFIDMHKEGAALRSMMNCFAISISLGLQHGVPLDEFVNVFTFTRFEPHGPVNHPNIKFATSVIDYIFRVLGLDYLGRTDFVHVKPADGIEEDLHHAKEVERDQKLALIEKAKKFGLPLDDMLSIPPASAPEDDPPTEPSSEVESVDREAKSEGSGFDTKSRMSQEGAPLDEFLGGMMGDAPFCDVCGHITVRNGSCYKCMSCGSSMGCS